MVERRGDRARDPVARDTTTVRHRASESTDDPGELLAAYRAALVLWARLLVAVRADADIAETVDRPPAWLPPRVAGDVREAVFTALRERRMRAEREDDR